MKLIAAIPLMAVVAVIFLLRSCSGEVSTDGETVAAVPDRPWRGIERHIRYRPDEGDFVITNGALRFNRALYGTHTGFRVEAGDLPEFALYLPGIGGNFKLGLIARDTSLWIIDAAHIVARYRPGAMIYEIGDPLLGAGTLRLTLMARADAEGMLLRMESRGVDEETTLLWVYGGASGKRFSRSGDLGADPESVFYLQPEYCRGNEFLIEENRFTLRFRSVRNGEPLSMAGVVPPGGTIRTCDAGQQDSPSRLLASDAGEAPVIAGTLPFSGRQERYFMISRAGPGTEISSESGPETISEEIAALFAMAESARKEVAGRIRVHTPDPWINNLGGALATAADAIWEEPSYLHGAVAWRMRLPGWRGAYAADWLGWHERARMHFEAYAQAQYTSPPEGPNAPDPATHLARQVEEKGNSLFTEGYISRNPGRISDPHHYDMNLVLIDQLLWHIQWTGDMEFARAMWPVLKRHLAWEKRCFDANGDGLYDAYAAIWASDALQYSGGGVTHSSAYNYRANVLAARVAEKLGEDPAPYREEAARILKAVNDQLWLPDKGWYAEYIDLLGKQRVHDFPAVWTIYHAIDGGISDPFQSWQSLRYIDRHIPHIPIRAQGLPEGSWYTLSNSSWMPYTWSINNVALAENMHTALAYWKAGRREEAFVLWKSQLLESMFLGSSPGNLQQLSFYDAFRGELYRDFADPVGMTARTLVEGLFGVVPDALEGVLTVNPGFPAEWEFASLETPSMSLEFQHRGNREQYILQPALPAAMELKMVVAARKTGPVTVSVNGEETEWSPVEQAVGCPVITFRVPAAERYEIGIHWHGEAPATAEAPFTVTAGELLELELPGVTLSGIKDPQKVLDEPVAEGDLLRSSLQPGTGTREFFLQAEQGVMRWWLPVVLEVLPPAGLVIETPEGQQPLRVRVRNNTSGPLQGTVWVNDRQHAGPREITVPPGSLSDELAFPDAPLVPGTNRVFFSEDNRETMGEVVLWEMAAAEGMPFRTVDLTGIFNDRVTQIFENRYLSPRCPYPTLQLPWQGIGDWASYARTADIDDSGLRARAGSEDTLMLRQGIPLATPGRAEADNILFTSLWDNYPDGVTIPLSGKASHAYLMMAGSTHHMQSRIANGEVVIHYTDGSAERLELINPDTWWPIEQDYYVDGYAFRIASPRPPRIHLKDGSEPVKGYPVLGRNKTNPVEGGAATLLDLPLDPGKELESITVATLSNDVVIGLMALTLIPAG